MRATRRNISVTNERVDIALERSENMSKFIEKCILYYLDREDKEFATIEDLAEQQQQIKILNQNYHQIKGILEEMAEVIFKK